MRIGIDANIVKGDIADVTASGAVILKNVVFNADTGTTAIPEGLAFRTERGSLLSSVQIVIPTMTLTRDQVYSLPTYMQVDIKRKAEEAKKKGD